MQPSFTDTFYGRPNTIRTYKSLFYRKIRRGILFPKACTENRLAIQVQDWLSEGLAPNTIKTLIRLTKEYVIWSGGESIDTRRMVSYVMKSRQKVPVKALTVEQAKKLVDRSLMTELELPIALGLYAGLRRGEVWGLQSTSVNLHTRKIIITRSYDGPTKSGQSREIPMSDALHERFVMSRYSWTGRVIKRRFDPNPGLKKLCRELAIPEITFHGLRHTFATAALQQGRSLKEVSTALGHVSVTTTIDIYWQCLEQMDTNLF